MTEQSDLGPQNRVLDWAKQILKLKKDSQLARAMCIATGTLSGIRADRNKFGPSYQLKIIKLTGITYIEMKRIMEGDTNNLSK